MGLMEHAALTGTPIPAELFDNLLADYPRRDFQVRFWDGSSWGASQQPRFTLVLKDPGALREMFLRASELSLAEAYLFGDLDIEGDIEAALDLAEYLLRPGTHRLAEILHVASLLRHFPDNDKRRARYRPPDLPGEPHCKQRDRQAIRYHYDLPPEFFALWLDRNMQYSAGYFADGPEMGLDEAQERKLDYICRKLRLRRGDRLLDIGCGWGALVVHAARQYGAQSLGITLSICQAEVARQRIREADLTTQCRVEVCDYRDLDVDEQFDKIASIGMFEHVGAARLQEYFMRARYLLRPGGAFLNSGIASPSASRPQAPSFIDRYVFPDGELVPLNITLGAVERSGFEVRDVESLREHYALTLHHWGRRLEEHAREARCIADETTYRVWRLYMAASAHRFRSGQLNLYHMLLVRPDDGKSGVPLTRENWYRP